VLFSNDLSFYPHQNGAIRTSTNISGGLFALSHWSLLSPEQAAFCFLAQVSNDLLNGAGKP